MIYRTYEDLFNFLIFNGSTPGMAIITDHISDVSVLSIHKCEEYGRKNENYQLFVQLPPVKNLHLKQLLTVRTCRNSPNRV